MITLSIIRMKIFTEEFILLKISENVHNASDYDRKSSGDFRISSVTVWNIVIFFFHVSY